MRCVKCKNEFTFDNKDTYFDERGYGYSTKLVKCKVCGCPNVVKYIDDIHLNINYDDWYYKF